MRNYFAALWILCLVSRPLAAATFVVTSTDDAEDFSPGNGICDSEPGVIDICNLRAALQEANATPGTPDTIVVGPGTYPAEIQFQPFEISSPVTLEGAGIGSTILGGANQATALVWIHPALGSTEIAIRNATLQGGLQNVVLHDLGTVLLDHLTIRANTGSFNSYAACILTGAAWGSSLRLERSTVTECTGHGVLVRYAGFNGPVDIADSVISACSGSGLRTEATAVTVRNSTISGNNAGAQSQGGGVYIWDGTLTLVNVTIADNTAGAGAGFYSGASPAVTYFDNVTVARNHEAENGCTGASYIGAGVYINFGTLNVANSIIAGNYMAHYNNHGFCIGYADDCVVTGGGFLGSNGRLLFGGPPNCVVANGYQTGDPLLDWPAANHGGYSPTLALLAGSPAIDAGDPSGCRETATAQTIVHDQRGSKRALGAACDLGAYEAGGIFADGFEYGDPAAWSATAP